MTQSTSETPWIDIARWILFLPGAVGGSLLITFLFNILSTFSEGFFVEPISVYTFFRYYFMSSLVTALSFVYCGSYIAPHQKMVVGVILGILCMLFIVVVETIVFLRGEFNLGSILTLAGWVIGTGMAMVKVSEKSSPS